MIPINAFPYSVRRRNLYLKTLKTLDREGILRTIRLFEKNINRIIREEEIKEEIKYIFPEETDMRKLNLLYYSLRAFYDLIEITMKQVLSGSSRFWKSEWDLRLEFYRWVQEKYGGFLSLDIREEALRRFSDEYGVPLDKLENILAGGILTGFKLIRKIEHPPTVDDVIGVSNFLLIEKLLAISEYAVIRFLGLVRKGEVLKEILFRAKRGRLVVSFRIEKEDLICELSGPFQIFKHPSPIYGEAISQSIVSGIAKHADWELYAKVKIRNRMYKVFVSSKMNSLKPIRIPWAYHKPLEKAFDSDVEKKIFFRLQRLFPAVRIIREGDIVVSDGGVVMIPDFTIDFGSKKVLIEVVGFWTESYARRKREKLDRAFDSGLRNIVVLVDKKVAKHFRDVKYPVIIYDKDLLVANKIKNAVKKVLQEA